jgi:aminoglycoside phosphotransferase (APT) family kinase protein
MSVMSDAPSGDAGRHDLSVEFPAWVHVLNVAMPVARLERARQVEGGNFTDVYELRGATARGIDLRLVARVFRVEARPGIVEKLLVVLPAAEAAGVPVPEVVWADPGGGLLGRPLLLCRWIQGNSFRDAPDLSSRIAQLARSLADIHGTKVDLDEVWAYPTIPPGHLRDWARRSDAAAPVLELVERLALNVPVKSGLVHGDFWSGNVLWLGGALAGVIDWDASGPGDAGADVAKARLDLALHIGLDAADAFVSRYAQERPVSEHQPFWNLREAVSGFPDPGRFWIPTYELLGCTGLSPDVVQDRFKQYLRACVRSVAG